jgi:acetyltransferase-like isoleucine patch superfamily enzyme
MYLFQAADGCRDVVELPSTMIGHDDARYAVFDGKPSCILHKLLHVRARRNKKAGTTEIQKHANLLSSAVMTPFTRIGNGVIVCSHLTSCICA